MPSRKGMEQAMTWLRSKMAEKDSLDAVNAEVCYNVILDLQKKRKVIGALYHQASMDRKRQMSQYKYDKSLLEEAFQELERQNRERVI